MALQHTYGDLEQDEPAEQWAANTKFLDKMIARGDNVVLGKRSAGRQLFITQAGVPRVLRAHAHGHFRYRKRALSISGQRQCAARSTSQAWCWGSGASAGSDGTWHPADCPFAIPLQLSQIAEMRAAVEKAAQSLWAE